MVTRETGQQLKSWADNISNISTGVLEAYAHTHGSFNDEEVKIFLSHFVAHFKQHFATQKTSVPPTIERAICSHRHRHGIRFHRGLSREG